MPRGFASFAGDYLAHEIGLLMPTGFSDEFGELLNYSRSLKFDQFPDYLEVSRSFMGLAERMGYLPIRGSLDWTLATPPTNPMPNEPDILISDMGIYNDDDLGEDSHFGLDIGVWERQGSRAKQEVELDNITPPIFRSNF